MEFLSDERQLTAITRSEVGQTGETALSTLPSLMLLERTPVPLNSRFQALFAKIAFSCFPESEKVFLKVEEWGIWPNEEDPVLIRLILKAKGIDVDPLKLRHFGFEFGIEERDLARALFRTVQSFGWGGIVTSERREFFIVFSHDGWIRLGSTDPDLLPDVQKSINDLIAAFESS
jgi:hypothetical protein